MTRMLLVTIAMLALPGLGHAVPGQLAHQGRLLDDNDVPIEDTHAMLFRMYDDLEGGEVAWEELHEVAFTNGYYSVILGADEEDNPLDTDLFSQYPLFLELTIDEGSPLAPRHELVSVPFSIMADTCENVMGGVVDVTEVRIDGETVITEGRAWAGEPSPVAWDDITGMPEGFADGTDDDTVLSESEVEDYITNEAIDLASDSTVGGEVISTGDHTIDTVLGESAVEDYITNEAIDLASDSTMGGEVISTGDHTTDTVLGESEVEAYITDDPIDLAAGSTIGGVEIGTPFSREAFRVHKDGVDQGGITTGALTRVSWPTEAFDTGDGFADDRFTSPAGGKYAFHAAVMFNELVHYDNMIGLYKNDSMIAMENYFIAVDGTNSGRPTMTVSTILHLEPGDYVDIWVHQESSDTLTVAGAEYATYFTGHRVDI